jgi:hypothetical protein
MFNYSQTYEWYFWFNDTAGNWVQTPTNTFKVNDTTIPTYSNLQQSNPNPEYDETNTVSVTVTEPINASGVDTIWLHYQIDGGSLIIVNVTETSNYVFTVSKLKYNQTYEWYFWFNDTAGNWAQTPTTTFTVNDTTDPTYSNLQQTTVNPEYDETNTVSVTINEPLNASGVDSIWLHYQINGGSLRKINVTESSSYIFTANMLKYNQTYEWYFWFNDTAGNWDQTPTNTFTVNDTVAPTYSNLQQTNANPEYDGSNTVSVTVSEPVNASGVDKVWLHYQIDNGPLTKINMTESSSYTFTANMLKYNQTYEWYFWFNDTAGNWDQTPTNTFTVNDTTSPIYSNLQQTNANPEYDGSNTVSVTVSEPLNASGVDTIWLHYQIDGGSLRIINVTDSSSYTFTANMLKYNQTYEWYFWFNDTAGNWDQTPINTFTVNDTTIPTYSNLQQTDANPEYDGSNTVSITVSEPLNASGVNSIWLHYQIDGGLLSTINVTESSSYTFTANMLKYNQTYEWYFWFNDTAGNWDQTLTNTFTVNDTTIPTYSNLQQTDANPEYDETNTVSVTVTEPLKASGGGSIWLHYQIDGGLLKTINVTESSSYTFTANMLKYNQTYEWYFWFNDTAGNWDQTPTITFTVNDTTPPTYSNLQQTTASPEYDETNTVSVTINEPVNASGVDSVWLYYQINGGQLKIINVSESSSYTFTANTLKYNQTYEWYFWFNDTAGNWGQTPINSFSVNDTTAPTYFNLQQSNANPEYDETNTVSVTVSEPVNASGVDSIWLHYQINGGQLKIINVTETSSYTFISNMLKYNQTYEWYFWFNDTAGNWDQTPMNTFTVNDTTDPIYSNLQQTTANPEYDESNIVSVTISEPVNASGVESIWLYYQINGGELKMINVTETSSYAFTANTLKYNQNYDWYFWFNDTAGNWDQTSITTFTVNDTTPPTYSNLQQTTASPEYDETNTVSVTINEPLNASGIDSIWLYYQIDGGSLIDVDVTETSSYTFTTSMLKYNQTYDWYFWFNDTAGNWAQTPITTFTVNDTTTPTYSNLQQTTTNPEYDGSNTVSILVSEPLNASGVESIWLHYQIDGGLLRIINVTETSSYTFTANMLKYNQTYEWYFWFNDTAGNWDQTPKNIFMVNDTTVPTYSNLQQTNSNPEYDETNTVSVTVTEPLNASGVESIWLYYQIDGGLLRITNVTETSSYTFTANTLKYNQTYEWFFWFNDTAGNWAQTPINSFTVNDTTEPTYSDLQQSNSNPECDETNTVSVTVNEPLNASGVDSIWLHYQIDSGPLIKINVTEPSSYTFTANMLKYNQTYEWYFWFNDTAGNWAQTPINSFMVNDTTTPTYSDLQQTTANPEYDETNTVSVTVNEPLNASGVDTIWLHYLINGGQLRKINVTESSSFTFTANMLKYNQTYDWYFWFNDTAGNWAQTPINSFMVNDTTTPTYSDLQQTTANPEYDETNTVSVTVNEPLNASGVATIWLHYQIDSGLLRTINVTESSSFTFTANMLKYDQTYEWYFWFNDTAGNWEQTSINTFTVNDTTTPTYSNLQQSNSNPECDETNTVSVTVNEPLNASGVDSIWLHYQIDSGPLIKINVTEPSSFTFTANMLKYNQTYEWYFWFNDTAGNWAQTPITTFMVDDTTAPTYSNLQQTTASPEYGGSNTVSIMVSEPVNASGVDTIWLHYQIDSGPLIKINVTEPSSFTFTASILKYNQTYEWYFWFNDTAGNWAQTLVNTFTVNDTISPTYSELQQTTASPEYDETNTVSVSVNEPVNASGVDTIWLHYQIDSGLLIKINVTESSGFTFTANMLKYKQTYDWYFWFNDTAGNWAQTPTNTFTVNDTTIPTYSNLQQTTVNPEYDETNTVAVTVSEPLNASGVDTIWLHYQIDGGPLTKINMTETSSYTFTTNMLKYNQTYDWYFWFNDTAGNWAQTPITTFTVNDTTAPTYSNLQQTTANPEYGGSNTVSISVSEPLNASGVESIWLHYQIDGDSLRMVNVTESSSFTFTASILKYNQTYEWYFWFNDTAGNWAQTPVTTFTVNDTISPTYSELQQTTASPEYDETNTVSVSVNEPVNASGVDTIWLHYQIDGGSLRMVNVTESSSFIFTANMLKYNQMYDWYFWFNDTAGNWAQTPITTFTVNDTTTPSYSDLQQTTVSPEYDGSNTVSISVSEPVNASGVESIWLHYQIDGGLLRIINVTETSSYTFTANMLKYNQMYEWYFWFNDTAGITTFTVNDTTAPTYSDLQQTTVSPEYDGSNTVSISVSEPLNASGVESIWLHYQIDSGPLIKINVTEPLIKINVTEPSSFTFTANMLKYNQTYEWYFWFNDTAGNWAQTAINKFMVNDTTTPIYSGLSQTNPTPEYDEANTVSIVVSEPVNASGVDSIWLYYQVDGGSLRIINITVTTSYTFTANMLKYNQTYDWYFWFNDTAGNWAQTPTNTFTVNDTTIPTYSNLQQSNTTPEYDESNTVAVTVSEPVNASGVDSIWLHYQIDSGLLRTINVTESNSYTFTSNMLKYNQTYEWYFWFNDTAGNWAQTPITTFTVNDTTPPTYSNLQQSNPTPEYDENNTVSVTVNEPLNASGVDSIWLHYQIDGSSLIKINVTETSSYTFTANMLKYNQTYEWYFWFNDTTGNWAQTPISTFTVIDITAFTYSNLQQTTATPEYDETNTVSVTIDEPVNSSGIDTI